MTVTVPFNEADLDRLEKATLTDGVIVECGQDRRVEVWRVKEEEGYCVRIFRSTNDGKTSKLMFGLKPPAAHALWQALSKQLRQPDSGVAVGSTDLLADFSVEYYDYDCGSPCTPNGCCGHSTDIPLSFTVGGVTFHVDGAQSGDFPDEKENTQRVCAVVKALGALISANETDLRESVHSATT